MYMYTDHIKIHAKYIQNTCKIHRIRILITNPPKFDNKPHVTHSRRGATTHIWVNLRESTGFCLTAFLAPRREPSRAQISIK